MKAINFSSKIRQLRENREISIRAMSQATGFSRMTIYRWEHDLCVPSSYDTVAALAAYFSVPIDYLQQDDMDFDIVIRRSPSYQNLAQRVDALENLMQKEAAHGGGTLSDGNE